MEGKNLIAVFALICIPVFQDAPKDDNPQVTDRISALTEAFKKKEDDAAIRAIDALTQLGEKAGPKDRTKIAKAVSGTYALKREDLRLYKAATFSLGTLGEDGAKPLVDAANDRTFKRPDDALKALRAEFTKAAGRTQSLKAVDPLLDLTKDKDYIVIAGACEGLGNYRKADEATRKKIVEKLIKLVVTAEASKLAEPTNGEAKLKYDTIGGVTINSLQALTGEKMREPDEWQKWWNENKKATWKPLN